MSLLPSRVGTRHAVDWTTRRAVAAAAAIRDRRHPYHRTTWSSSSNKVPWATLVAVSFTTCATVMSSVYQDDDDDRERNHPLDHTMDNHHMWYPPFRLEVISSSCDNGMGSHHFQISAALEAKEELEKVRLAQLVHDMHVLATATPTNKASAGGDTTGVGPGTTTTATSASTGTLSLRRYVTMFRPKTTKGGSDGGNNNNNTAVVTPTTPTTTTTSSSSCIDCRILQCGTIEEDNYCIKLPQGDLTTSISPAICDSLVHAVKAGGRLPLDCLTRLLEASQKALLKEPTVLDLSKHESVIVVGDLHGDLNSLATILHLIGDLQQKDDEGHEKIIVFDGDFVDRGNESLEVFVILLLLKLAYPQQVYLLRGNHEDSLIASVYGFQDEVRMKYGGTNEKLWNDMAITFATLPIAAITDNALILHGGIPSKEFHINDLQKITPYQRSQIITMAVELKDEPLAGIQRLLKDVLWSDPDANGCGIKSNPRGCGVAFGLEIVGEVLEKHNKRFLVRGHQPMPGGFGTLPCNVKDSPHEVLTVFSTASYSGGVVRNRGAILRLMSAKSVGGTNNNNNNNDVGYRVTTFERDDESSHTSEGVQTIRSLIAAKKEKLAAAFTTAQNLLGFVTFEQWSTILSEELDLPDMPWQVLQPSLCPNMMMGMVFWKLFLHQHSLKNGVVNSEADAHHLAALHDNHEMLLTVFKFLDVDGSGEISLQEFKAGVGLLNRHLPADRQLLDPEKLFWVLDKDRSGKIDFEVFEQIFEVM